MEFLMILLEYNIKLTAKATAMDIYYHVMFKSVFGTRTINDKLRVTSKKELKQQLSKLTHEHPVRWDIVILYRKRKYEIGSEGGKLYDRRIEDGNN